MTTQIGPKFAEMRRGTRIFERLRVGRDLFFDISVSAEIGRLHKNESYRFNNHHEEG